jgi:hypothetical protein
MAATAPEISIGEIGRARFGGLYFARHASLLPQGPVSLRILQLKMNRSPITGVSGRDPAR